VDSAHRIDTRTAGLGGWCRVGSVCRVRMPATLSEVAEAVEQVLADGAARTEEQIVAALEERGVELGVDSAETLAEVLDSDELPLVLPLGEGRHALLPGLLDGRTFTHRLSATEVEHGYLSISPDLEPVSILTDDPTYRRLVDGSPLTEALAGLDAALFAERGIPLDANDDAAWILEPDALKRLGVAAGELVGVTVRPGGFELTAVPEGDAPTGLGERLLDVLQRLGAGEPEQIDGVVWLACADYRDLFGSALPPLAEVFTAARLAWEGEQLAPSGFDFAGWRVHKHVEYLADLHRLDDDAALAVVAITRLYEQVAEVFDRTQQLTETGRPLTDVLPETTDDDAAPEPPTAASAPDERMLVRATLDFLADPAVAQAVLVETIGAGRDGAGALGLFAESLEPQAPRSARPALRWLRGKALERLGSIGEAEPAFEAALTLDATWPPALFELARYASDRGDAEGGLSLLRRAGAPADDELIVLLQRFRPVGRKDVGRNQPCWCGSGRKYKVCHRGREQLPLEERAAWLYQKACTYLADGPWRGEVMDAARIRAQYSDRPLAIYAATQDPLVCDAVLFEGGAFAEFLAERGPLLPDDERLLAEQWLLAERSIYEVDTCRAGTGFTARDLRTGDRLDVRERSGSRSLKAGMFICARIVPAAETMQCFGGIEPVALRERDELIRLLDSEPDPLDLVDLLSRRFAPPVLQTTEGEDLVLCEATLRSPDPAALAAALDDVYDRDEPELRWFEHVTTYGVQRIRATITLDEEQVRVETNSEPRMDRALDRLHELQPGLDVIQQTRRPVEDMHEAMSRAPGGTPAEALDPADYPKIAAALEQMTRQHERAWLDEKIPALAGVTPREAAADPTRRSDLIRLLDSFPPAGPGAMNADRLRAELGL
jgi:tetratricopeptide (TPR) repeat protein